MLWGEPRISRKPAQQAYEVGLKAESEGRLKDADRAFTQALEADPNLGLAWFHRGKAAVADGRYGQAVVDLNNAAKMLPPNGELPSFAATRM